MRVLLAPQELKGSLTAVAAVEAMAAGVRRAVAAAVIDRAPLADGGPGTVDALVTAAGGERRTISCRDPLGRPVAAAFGLLDGGRTAAIEMAAAAGLLLLRPEERDPLRAGTEGVGDLIRAALDVGARRIIVGLGGSATNDGGAGMARALGVRFLDAAGRDLPPGGAALAALDRIEIAGLDQRLRGHGVTIEGATDVRNPLCGQNGASAVYGPQKGATAEQVRRLDAALARFAAIVARDLGVPVAEMPGAGAAGGLGAGLAAFLGARLASGFDLVAGAAGLDERVARAGLVLTGEGRIDRQSLFGKTTVGVARLGRRHGVPVVALCGSLGPGWEAVMDEGLTAALSLTTGPMPLARARRHAATLLAGAAEQACRIFAAGGTRPA